MSDKKKKLPEFNYLLPPEECERIYEVLGNEPGLDPCGHADQFLKAKKVMLGVNEDDDGFQADWSSHGSVVLNAPHGEREPDWDKLVQEYPGWQRPTWPWHTFTQWVSKASAEAQRGATVFAFMPAATDRRWFHLYASSATSIAFLSQRVKCYRPSPVGGVSPTRDPQPMNAHMMVLFTQSSSIADRFFEVYSKRGMIVEPSPVHP